MSYNFKNFAFDVLAISDKPLSAMEIWNVGVTKGFDKKLETKGKTPWATIGAQIYTDIKTNETLSKFKQVSRRPALFTLSDKHFSPTVVSQRQAENENLEIKNSYHERDLHAPLVKFLKTNNYFKCYTKTVFHEKSKKGKLNQDKWTYPDLIGIYFPFGEFEPLTLKSLNLFKEKTYKVFSFEMKKKIDLGNLRSEYFQAVSNSSWANEGYLVAPVITIENEEFLSELTMLNNAFGIGVIKLNIEIPEESEILFYSKQKQHLDSNMLDKLILKNNDVKELFKCIIDSQTLEKVVDEEKIFDKVLINEEYSHYIKEKKLLD